MIKKQGGGGEGGGDTVKGEKENRKPRRRKLTGSVCLSLELSGGSSQYSAVIYGLNERKGQLLLSSEPLSGFIAIVFQWRVDI